MGFVGFGWVFFRKSQINKASNHEKNEVAGVSILGKGRERGERRGTGAVYGCTE